MPFFGQARGPALSRVRPRVLKTGEKMGLPWDAYYVLTKAQANLPNSKVHPNTGAPDYNIVHNVSGLTGNTDDLDEGTTNLYYKNTRVGTYGNTQWLKLDGSNANQNIDIGTYSATSLGTARFGTVAINAGAGDSINLGTRLISFTGGDGTVRAPAGQNLLLQGNQIVLNNNLIGIGKDLGASTSKFANIYLSANISDGTNALTVANAKTAYDHTLDDTIHFTLPDLNDLGDVNAPTPNDNDALFWDAGTSKWVPEAVLGESTTVSTPLVLTDYDISIPAADTDTDGYLSSTDWDTFNTKSDLALGETSTTAYRGDRGKTAYDHVTADGDSHGFIDQDVTIAADVTHANIAVPTNGKVYLEGYGSDTYITFNGTIITFKANNTTCLELSVV